MFISYASADRDVVAPFVRQLKVDGLKVWFDDDEMAGGRPAMPQLANTIHSSTHVIACLTDTYVQRQRTAFELQVSRHLAPGGRSGRLIPVQFRSLTLLVPVDISFLAICDLTEYRDYDRAYCNILRSVWQPAPEAITEGLETACTTPFEHLGVGSLFIPTRGHPAHCPLS